MRAESLNPIRVMIVDDHPMLLWGLAKLIDGEQPRMKVVGQALTRDEAFEAARREKPDVILLDLDLGLDSSGRHVSSLDFLSELIRESKAKVLILTGLNDDEQHDRAVLEGARGIITKDEKPDTILRAIEKVHQGHMWATDATDRVLEKLLHGNEEREEDPASAGIASLTEKEREIVCATSRFPHLTRKKLAGQLNMSEHTLRNHLTSIYDKLGVNNRLDLFIFTQKHNLNVNDS